MDSGMNSNISWMNSHIRWDEFSYKILGIIFTNSILLGIKDFSGKKTHHLKHDFFKNWIFK